MFAKDKGNVEAAIPDLTAALTVHAKVADSVGNEVAAATGWTYLGLDPTATALGDVSIAGAIEAFTGARFGSSGTLTAARIITTAEKAIPVRQVGYSGLMLPVLEDKLLAQRWAESTYDVDSLLAYSSVCATGLDTVPLGFFILSLVAMIFWRHGFVHGLIAVLIIVFVGGWVRFFVNCAFGLVVAILNRKSLN